MTFVTGFDVNKLESDGSFREKGCHVLGTYCYYRQFDRSQGILLIQKILFEKSCQCQYDLIRDVFYEVCPHEDFRTIFTSKNAYLICVSNEESARRIVDILENVCLKEKQFRQRSVLKNVMLFFPAIFLGLFYGARYLKGIFCSR